MMMGMSPRLLRPRASGGFNPKSIAGLQLWLDASDSTTMTLNGTTVSEWRSKEGSIAVSQGTASEQPTLTTGYYSNRSALTFDGGDCLFDSSAPLALAPCTTFIVLDETTAGSFAGVLIGTPSSGDDFGASDAFIATVHDGPANEYFRRATAPLGAASDALIADSPLIGAAAFGKNLFTSVIGASSGVTRRNGTAGTTDSAHTASGSCSGLLVGGRFIGSAVSGGFRFTGKICEILHYSQQLSDAQVASVEKWLGNRWGITLA